MENKNNLTNCSNEFVENIEHIKIQERIINELLDSKEKLIKMISDTEKLKKRKALNWFGPSIGFIVILFIAGCVIILNPGFLNPGFISISSIRLIIGKITLLIMYAAFTIAAVSEEISCNLKCFRSKIEEQNVNKSKLEFIEKNIEIEKEYLENLKKQESNNMAKTSSSNERDRLYKLRDYYLSYYINDRFSASLQEMRKRYPYPESYEKQNEITEVKTLVKKKI